MQIDISTRHGHLSEEAQQKIREKAERLSRFHERIRSVAITVDLQHEQSPAVEVRASVDRNPEFVAHANADSLWGSVDGALHKIEDQLRKSREKSVDHRAARRRTEDPVVVSDSDANETSDEES